jgi:hypothetical protein
MSLWSTASEANMTAALASASKKVCIVAPGSEDESATAGEKTMRHRDLQG